MQNSACSSGLCSDFPYQLSSAFNLVKNLVLKYPALLETYKKEEGSPLPEQSDNFI